MRKVKPKSIFEDFATRYLEGFFYGVSRAVEEHDFHFGVLLCLLLRNAFAFSHFGDRREKIAEYLFLRLLPSRLHGQVGLKEAAICLAVAAADSEVDQLAVRSICNYLIQRRRWDLRERPWLRFIIRQILLTEGKWQDKENPLVQFRQVRALAERLGVLPWVANSRSHACGRRMQVSSEEAAMDRVLNALRMGSDTFPRRLLIALSQTLVRERFSPHPEARSGNYRTALRHSLARLVRPYASPAMCDWVSKTVARLELREFRKRVRQPRGMMTGLYLYRWSCSGAFDPVEQREVVLGLVQYLCKRKRLRRHEDPDLSETFWATELVVALFQPILFSKNRSSGIPFSRVADAFEWYLNVVSPKEKHGEIPRLAFEMGTLEECHGGFRPREKEIFLNIARRVRRKRGELLAEFEGELKRELYPQVSDRQD